MEKDEVAGRLIADLEAAAELVDHGEFSIDEAMARTKLAAHRLGDPDVWACLMVEAASLLGSAWVRAYTFSGELWLEFGGEPIDGDRLFTDAIASAEASDPNRRVAARKLAIAIDAVFAQNPDALVEIESPKSMVRLRADAPNECTQGSGTHTIVRVKAVAQVQAVELLRERCRYSPLDIAIDHRAISRRLREFVVDERCTAITAILDEDRTIGYAGFRGGEQPSIVELLTHGVTAERLLDPRVGFVAIVDVPLGKDIGERSVIRDVEFERILALVRATFDRIAATHPSPLPPPAVPPGQRRPRLIAAGVAIAGVALTVLVFLMTPSDPDPRREDGKARHREPYEHPLDGSVHPLHPPQVEVVDVDAIPLEPGPGIQRLEGHAQAVVTIEVIHHGTFVSASGDDIVTWTKPFPDLGSVREPGSWQSAGLLRGHAGPIYDFAAQSNQVVSASADTTLRIWRTNLTEPIAVLEGHDDAVIAVEVTPELHIVSLSRDGNLRVWDEVGTFLAESTLGSPGEVVDFAILWNGRILDNRAVVLDIGSGKMVSLRNQPFSCEHVLATADGQIVFADPGGYQTWISKHPELDRVTQLSTRDTGPTTGLTMLFDHVVTTSHKTLRIWPTPDGPMSAFVGPDELTTVTAWRDQLFVGDAAGRIWVIDPYSSALRPAGESAQ